MHRGKGYENWNFSYRPKGCLEFLDGAMKQIREHSSEMRDGVESKRRRVKQEMCNMVRCKRIEALLEVASPQIEQELQSIDEQVDVLVKRRKLLCQQSDILDVFRRDFASCGNGECLEFEIMTGWLVKSHAHAKRPNERKILSAETKYVFITRRKQV
jgi:hypothetical protein